MSHLPRSVYGNMTNAADTYYGTLFSHLSYGMGENGGGANPNPSANYADAAAAAAAAAMAAATGVGDWTTVGGYPQGSGMLTGLNQPSMSLGAGVTNPADLPLPSGAATASPSANMTTSPYCATLLAAVAAAAAAAAYPVHPNQSTNVSTGSSTPNADYAAMYYRSSGPRQPVASSAASLYNNAAYPTASWPYSVSPNHYANNSHLIDRINPALMSMDGWSTSNGQPAVVPSMGSELDVVSGRQHMQQQQHMSPAIFSSTSISCDRNNSVQRDPTAHSYYAPSSARKANPTVPVSQMPPSTGDDRSGLYSVLSGEANDNSYLSSEAHHHQLVNGVATGSSAQAVYHNNMEPFPASSMHQHSTEQTRQQQQQRILDEFSRLSVESNRDYTANQSGNMVATESNSDRKSQPTNPSQWHYEGELVTGDSSANVEQRTRASGGILRATVPTSTMLNSQQQQHPGPMAYAGHQSQQPASEAPRTKTWANIAGQPPKGSAAVLMSSTGWSTKRIPGHVLTQNPGLRGSLATPSASVITAKPQSTLAKSEEAPNTTSFRSGLRPEASGTSENGHNTISNNTTANGNNKPGGYEESLQLLQREAELLHQRLAKSINPAKFDTNVEKARFFVIKSFSEDDIHRSIKYAVWCSTELGNKKLDAAFVEAKGQYPIYLFYSVNGSGHFCGMAEMTSRVDYDTRMRVWAQDKWQGAFSVRWIFVKDVPNTALRHIRVETNENKPVTHSRDTTELPLERGRQVMEVFANYSHTLSIFDDFVFYEQRERQDGFRRKEIGNRRS